VGSPNLCPSESKIPDKPPPDPLSQPPDPSAGDGQADNPPVGEGVAAPPDIAQSAPDAPIQQPIFYPKPPGQGLPETTKEALNAAAMRAILEIEQTQVWHGQLPPPEAIERFEKILPGSFDRILKMAEKQQDAQIKNITQAQNYARNDIRRGHYLGFALSTIAIISAGWFVNEHSPIVAGLCLGVPVLAVAKALIDSARPREGLTLADELKTPSRKSGDNSRS